MLEFLTPKFLSPQKLFEQADCHIKPSTLFGIGLFLAGLGATATIVTRIPLFFLPLNALILFSIPFLWLLNKRRGRLAKFAAQDKPVEHQTSILQALYLMNNEFITDRTSLEHNKSLAAIANQATTTARKIDSLYLLVLSRKPRAEEKERLVKYVDDGGPTRDSKKALTDIFWVLLNSSEFILNH